MPVLLDNYKIQQKFYQSLTETSNSLALSQMWLFKIPGQYVRALNNYFENFFNDYEGFTNRWDIFDSSAYAVHTRWFIGDTYYILARGVTFPGDGLSTDHAGVQHSGFIPGLYGESRNKFTPINVVFLETNQSIADLFFRPWLIMVGYKSLKDFDLRVNLELDCYQKDGVDRPIKLRKTVRIQDAAPISVDQEEFNYTADKVVERTVEFAYKRYNIIANAAESVFNDEEQYKKLIGSAEPTGFIGVAEQMLNTVREGIDTANRVYSDISGKAERVQTATTQALRNVGLDRQADRVDDAFARARENIGRPVDTVITTANKVANSAGAVLDIGREIADINKNAQPNFTPTPEIKPVIVPPIPSTIIPSREVLVEPELVQLIGTGR